ncbi:MAG: GAF domain-containing protein [Chloroflexota bacterium]
MTTLTLITTDVTLIGNWQALSPQVVDTVPDTTDDVWLLDCTSLPTDTIRAVIEQAPPLCFALVDNQALLNIGGVLFDSDIPILKKPLTAHGRATIEQALSGTENDLDATQTRPTAFTGLAQEFALRSTDVRQFTHKIATAVKDMMKADWVAFVSVTFDQTENYSADVLAMVGDVPEDHADNVVRPNGFTLHILKTQLPVVMPDARTFKLDDIQVNPRTLEAGFRAGLGLPLLLQDGEPFGVMWVMYNEPHLFTYADVRHMQVYASHVALAYSYHVQKKLVGQWQIAAQRIFTRPLNHHTLTETLDYITTGIHDSLDCDAVMLFFREYEDDAYQVFHDGTMDVNQYDLVRLPLFHEMTQADEPLILDNAPADTRLTDILPVRQGLVQSVVLMPLAHANQSIGLIWLYYHDARHFTEEEATAIKLFADQIAVSITNAVLDAQQNLINQKNNDLIQQLQEQGEQLRNLVKVIDIERNLNNQDRQAILKTIARQTCVAADADRVTIRLVQDDHVAALAVYPETDDDIDVKQSVNWQIRVGGHSQYIVETNQPVIIPDVDNYDPTSYSGIAINPRWRGVWKARIGLPLTSGEKTIGVMWLSFKHARPVTSSQLSAFQSFANIVHFGQEGDIGKGLKR